MKETAPLLYAKMPPLYAIRYIRRTCHYASAAATPARLLLCITGAAIFAGAMLASIYAADIAPAFHCFSAIGCFQPASSLFALRHHYR